MPCFWCNRRTKLTVEHVIPVCNGGDNSDSNIVRACKPCNVERGHITTFWGQLNALLEIIDDNCYFTLDGAIAGLTRLVKKQPEIARLQQKWIKIETEILGYSPSGDLCIAVPELPIEV